MHSDGLFDLAFADPPNNLTRITASGTTRSRNSTISMGAMFARWHGGDACRAAVCLCSTCPSGLSSITPRF